MMRIFFRAILFAVLAGTVFFAWQSIPFPCEQPLEYSLGSFDARFGIAEAEFLKEISVAEKVWEDASGKNLFAFAPDAPFRINLVFDERQERTLDGQELDQSLEETKARQETLAEKNAASFALYERTLKEYEASLAAFEKRLTRYNSEVEKWNEEGGAPPEEYEKLEDEAEALKDLQKKLENKRRQVNALADTVNRFSKEQVRVVDKYNSQVEGYVKRYGEPKDFDQGMYGGTSIDIYQFDDRAHLRLVLVHELGHALGIGHVSDPLAIMYYLMEQQDPDALELTAADRMALSGACAATPGNIWKKLSWRYRLLAE